MTPKFQITPPPRATKSDTSSVQRGAIIAAPPDKLFNLISDTRALNTRNLYARKDPLMKLRYEGAAGMGGSGPAPPPWRTNARRVPTCSPVGGSLLVGTGPSMAIGIDQQTTRCGQ